jgi:hypothetical protein
MKLLENRIYLEFQELVDCGVKEGTITLAKHRKSPSWDFREDPNDRRKVLVGYEALKDQYKQMVIGRYGNPKEYIAKEPLRRLLTRDLEAHKFYLAYSYGEGKHLSQDHVERYTIAASWLNLLISLNDDKRQIKKALGLTMDAFWTNVLDLISKDRIELPTSIRRLTSRMKEYQEHSYAALIDWRFGNKLAAKVKDAFSESLLLELIAHPNQYDDFFIAQIYNKEAIEKGYDIITPATVGVWRRKKGFEILAQREGWAAFEGKYRRQLIGRRPSAPLYLVESDDNHLDLLFLDVEDTTGSKFYKKFKAIVVIDSFNDYVLGYAYSQDLTNELVRAAYANAMYHIRSLTGGWYLPHEIKTDNWGIKDLQPFYESAAKFIPSPVGSKKRGYIEQFFGSAHWKRSLKLGANNYTGNNISAKTRGVNTEVLHSSRKEYPTLQHDAVHQIEQFFQNLRMMPQNSGKSKQQEWLEAWAGMPESDKRVVTDEQFLLIFGVPHKYDVSITNKGVTPQIGGIQYSYDVPPALTLQVIGRKVGLRYDPADMSRVLIHDDSNIRFVATSTQIVPKSLRDLQPGDRSYINALLAEKRSQSELVAERSNRRSEVLADSGVDVESMLIGAGHRLPKNVKQELERRHQAQLGESIPSNLYDQM